MNIYHTLTGLGFNTSDANMESHIALPKYVKKNNPPQYPLLFLYCIAHTLKQLFKKLSNLALGPKFLRESIWKP